MDLFGTKTLLKTCLNTRENQKSFLSKVLSKSPKKWGIYSPFRKLAVSLICQPDRLSVDRPVDRQRSKIRPLEQPGRPPGYRELGSLVRSTAQIQRAKLSGPVDRPTVPADVHSSVHIGRPPCRPYPGSVDRTVDRPGPSAQYWVRNWVRKTC